MPGYVENERRVARIVDRSRLDDVEASIAKQQCRAAREPTDLGAVQHLNPDARAVRGANLRRRRRWRGARPARSHRHHDAQCRDDEPDRSNEKGSTIQRTAFQSPTVSGNKV